MRYDLELSADSLQQLVMVRSPALGKSLDFHNSMFTFSDPIFGACPYHPLANRFSWKVEDGAHLLTDRRVHRLIVIKRTLVPLGNQLPNHMPSPFVPEDAHPRISSPQNVVMMNH